MLFKFNSTDGERGWSGPSERGGHEANVELSFGSVMECTIVPSEIAIGSSSHPGRRGLQSILLPFDRVHG